MLTLPAPPDVVTFDCFGTLVEWDAVLLPAIATVLQRHGRADIAGETVLAAFHRLSFSAQDRPPYRPYAEIVRTCFGEAFGVAGVAAASAECDAMVEALRQARPHPDVPPALARLKPHCRIGIITNSDDDIVGPCIARLGVAVDVVVTAAMARAYKPSDRIFDLADRLTGATADNGVHVAMSMALDIAACEARGRRCVWINRRGMTGPQPHRADAMLDDLGPLPSLLGLP